MISFHAGEAVRILSGAPLPDGADTVVSEEFTQAFPEGVEILNHAGNGRNILPKSTDIRAGQVIVPRGRRLYPTSVGLLAAAGYQEPADPHGHGVHGQLGFQHRAPAGGVQGGDQGQRRIGDLRA